MDHLTARLLLLLTLVGPLAPVALAISAPLPHACCIRKPMHDRGSRALEFRSTGSERRSCCPPVTTAHWAQPGLGTKSDTHPLLAYLAPQPNPPLLSNFENALRPVRGPPLT